ALQVTHLLLVLLVLHLHRGWPLGVVVVTELGRRMLDRLVALGLASGVRLLGHDSVLPSTAARTPTQGTLVRRWCGCRACDLRARRGATAGFGRLLPVPDRRPALLDR